MSMGGRKNENSQKLKIRKERSSFLAIPRDQIKISKFESAGLNITDKFLLHGINNNDLDAIYLHLHQFALHVSKILNFWDLNL